MLKEFKKFIMTGNVIDFAVAVIMAGALGAVIKGFVDKIAMPLVSTLTGDVNFADRFWNLTDTPYETLAAAKEAGAAVVAYGSWINDIISLLIIGFVMFMVVKGYNKTKAPEPEAAPAGPSDNDLLKEILEALKK
ncbi:MAG: large conductance mechanosensitive channel protein MscL [Bacteroidia bacterium]